MPNGVDIGWFKPIDRNDCRAKLGWKMETKVILFNGSHDGNQAVKNLPLAKTTVNIVKKVVSEIRLHVMSSATREQVRLMLNAADCLLVTSLHEGSPNIVKEAMACNLPVVSVPCGDVIERLSTTRRGAICAYDPATLAEALHEVFKAGQRSNGREQLLAQGLTTVKVAERLIQIYHLAQQKYSSRPENRHRKICVE